MGACGTMSTGLLHKHVAMLFAIVKGYEAATSAMRARSAEMLSRIGTGNPQLLREVLLTVDRNVEQSAAPVHQTTMRTIRKAPCLQASVEDLLANYS